MTFTHFTDHEKSNNIFLFDLLVSQLTAQEQFALNASQKEKVEFLLNFQCSKGNCLLLETAKGVARIELSNVHKALIYCLLFA